MYCGCREIRRKRRAHKRKPRERGCGKCRLPSENAHPSRAKPGCLTHHSRWSMMRPSKLTRRKAMFRQFLFASLILLILAPLAAQEQKAKVKKAPPERPTPTVADYAYAKDHERQK